MSYESTLPTPSKTRVSYIARRWRLIRFSLRRRGKWKQGDGRRARKRAFGAIVTKEVRKCPLSFPPHLCLICKLVEERLREILLILRDSRNPWEGYLSFCYRNFRPRRRQIRVRRPRARAVGGSTGDRSVRFAARRKARSPVSFAATGFTTCARYEDTNPRSTP